MLALAVDSIVNAYVTYRFDVDAAGNDAEHWQSPTETVNQRAGDCEDFQILKYYALRYLGVPESRLYIAAVDSHITNAGETDLARVDHAVLLLNTGNAENPDWVVLDQAYKDVRAPADNVLPAERTGYTFYFILNNNHSWMFNNEAGATTLAAAAQNSPAAPTAATAKGFTPPAFG